MLVALFVLVVVVLCSNSVSASPTWTKVLAQQTGDAHKTQLSDATHDAKSRDGFPTHDDQVYHKMVKKHLARKGHKDTKRNRKCLAHCDHLHGKAYFTCHHLCTVRHKAIHGLHGLPNAPTFPPTSYPTYTPTIMPTTLPPRPHGRGWRHRHGGYRHRGYRHGRNRHGRNRHRGYRPRYTPKPLKAGVYFKLNPLDREINSPFAYVYGQGFEGRTFMGPDADQKPDGFGNTHHTVASDRELEARRAFPDHRPYDGPSGEGPTGSLDYNLPSNTEGYIGEW